MATDSDDTAPAEAEMLPDERDVIAERAKNLDELDEDDFLSIGELAEQLGFDPE